MEAETDRDLGYNAETAKKQRESKVTTRMLMNGLLRSAQKLGRRRDLPRIGRSIMVDLIYRIVVLPEQTLREDDLKHLNSVAQNAKKFDRVLQDLLERAAVNGLFGSKDAEYCSWMMALFQAAFRLKITDSVEKYVDDNMNNIAHNPWHSDGLGVIMQSRETRMLVREFCKTSYNPNEAELSLIGAMDTDGLRYHNTMPACQVRRIFDAKKKILKPMIVLQTVDPRALRKAEDIQARLAD